MDVNNQIRIGQIGCGNWGKNILRDLKTLGCHVTVVSRSEENRQKALTLGADAVAATTADLKNVHGFIVVTPTSTHAAVIKELVPYNLPIFVEKPLTNNLEDALAVTQLIGDKLFVMDKWRYHPGVEILKKIAREQTLGPVLSLQTLRFSWGNPHFGDVDGIWILAPHDLSICLEILGYIPQPKFATATKWQAEAVSLTGILGDKPTVQINISTIHTPFQREVRLECSEGVATLRDGWADCIEIVKRDSWNKELVLEKIPFPNEMPLYKELEAFVNYLQTNTESPRSNAQEGLEIVRVITELRGMAKLDVAENYYKKTVSSL